MTKFLLSIRQMMPLDFTRKTLLSSLIILFGVLMGVFIVKNNPFILIFLLAGVLTTVIILNQPLIGIIVLLGTISFISFHDSMPFSNIGSINFPDLILGLLLSMLIYRILFSSNFSYVHTPLDKPLIAFFLIGLFTYLLDISVRSYNVFYVFKQFKVIPYYLLTIVITNSVQNRKQLKTLIYFSLLIGTLSALNVIIKGFVTHPTMSQTAMESYYKYHTENTGVFYFWTLIHITCLMLVTKVPLIYILQGIVCLSAVILRFSRSYWVSGVLSIALSFALVCRGYKDRIVKYSLLLVCLILLILSAFFLRVEPIASYIDLAVKRVDSLTSLEKVGTLDDRITENKYAVREILHHPIHGIGFVSPYRPQIYGPEDSIDWFLHNGYLWITLKMGLLGLVAFLWFSYVFARRALTNWRNVNDDFFKGIVLGSVVTYFAFALQNLTIASFIHNWEVAIFGISFGINECIYRFDESNVLYA